ncbi:hypothetical protein RR11_1087 [Ruegeria sp. R11]|nr:hypothetical protein RR11_1087 [Ruegeria sp. R11]
MATKRKDHLKISLAAEKRSDFAGFAPNLGELPKKRAMHKLQYGAVEPAIVRLSPPS